MEERGGIAISLHAQALSLHGWPRVRGVMQTCASNE
jgi:hypothetical protein